MIDSNVPPPIGCYFPTSTMDNRSPMPAKGFSPYSPAPTHSYSCSSSGYPYPLPTGKHFSFLKLIEI